MNQTLATQRFQSSIYFFLWPTETAPTRFNERGRIETKRPASMTSFPEESKQVFDLRSTSKRDPTWD